LHAYTSKTPKHLLLLFSVKLVNQYLQLLMGLTTFSLSKGTTIDLLHLGVITPLPFLASPSSATAWQSPEEISPTYLLDQGESRRRCDPCVHISEALLVAALIGLDPKEYDYRKNISAM
jgi:hypothetical protein